MADDFNRCTDSARAVEIDGRTWQVGRFTPRDMGDLQQFIREAIPDPRERARSLCAGMSDAVALRIWDDLNAEAADWPPAFGSPAFNRVILHTLEGNARLLWVVLRRHNRNVDLDRARELAESIDLDTVNRVLELALPEYARDPKAGAKGPTATD